ncbi:MAG: tyrosine-protein phosphatase [Anaerolineales bacterium]|nr:tyrosine-protein phosphatase [Anaerolineales bacterium]
MLDLRGAEGVEKKPDRIYDSSRPRMVHLPMWTPEMERLMEGWNAANEGAIASEDDPTKLYVDVYRSVARDCSAEIRAVLEQLSDPQNLPTLIHCSAGKDRTGLVTAFLLTALGVRYADVVQDYVLTNPCIHNWVEKFVVNDLNPDMSRRFLEARHEFLDAAYQMVRLNHGSPDAYISDVLGFDKNRVEALRSALLEQID